VRDRVRNAAVSGAIEHFESDFEIPGHVARMLSRGIWHEPLTVDILNSQSEDLTNQR
jgi:hypothetical protein